MLETDLLEYIECAIPHNCVRKSNSTKKCAQCAIKYSFIAKQPVILECGHQICSSCEDKAHKSSLICKICELRHKKISTIQSTGAKNKLAEKVIEDKLSDIYIVLRKKFQEGCDLFKKRKSELELSVASKVQVIKDEIDLKIESAHAEIEAVRTNLYTDVDKYWVVASQ